MLGSTLLVMLATHKKVALIFTRFRDRGSLIVVSFIWQVVTYHNHLPAMNTFVGGHRSVMGSVKNISNTARLLEPAKDPVV